MNPSHPQPDDQSPVPNDTEQILRRLAACAGEVGASAKRDAEQLNRLSDDPLRAGEKQALLDAARQAERLAGAAGYVRNLTN